MGIGQRGAAPDPHAQPADAVAAALGVDVAGGLSAAQAAAVSALALAPLILAELWKRRARSRR